MSEVSGISGQLSRHGDTVDVRLEHTYPVERDVLWKAISEPEQLAGWFATIKGELTEGGRCHVVFDADNPEQQINGTIEECAKGERLVLSWEMLDHSDSTVAATLSAGKEGTILTLEHHRMQEDTAAAYGAGWQAYLEALAAFLEGNSGIRERWDARWQELLPLYLHEAAGL